MGLRLSSDPAIRIPIFVLMTIFVIISAVIAYDLVVTNSSHLPKFNMEATKGLNNGKIVDETHTAFDEYDKICLFSLLGAKNKETEACGIFEYSAIGLIKDNQCRIFSAYDINARIYFEYEVECRENVNGFQIKIFESNDTRIVNTLAFIE